MDSESALIRRAAAGDPAAFESLFRSHQGRVYGLCLRMTGSAQVAEDCMQEAFVRAWSKLDRFRGDSSFATWMHRIAVNEVLGWQRREGRRGQHLELFEERIESRDAASGAADVEARLELERAVKRLPEGARNVFVLTGLYGHSHEEAATMLGIAVGTSKAQLHRARRLLAEQLQL
ncbi:MAG: sigma-70 family RNA polymerase sigma factor [Chromatiales bacterium]|jgi:RNA polymerase sigma-70 factor (ECF subfamily)|nr:sigma-70 family RNA polymerase sigma factor [Chromatiales bacterium]PLX56115.1 MAG: RNA polymerase sigma factor [Chromatiales bacterium]